MIMVKCKKCNEEIVWLPTKDGKKKYPANPNTKPGEPNHFHSKTCKCMTQENKPEEQITQKQEVTIGDVFTNHEARIRELETIVRHILIKIGMIYLGMEKISEADKK